MSDREQATPGTIHTLESLCNELVSGRGIIVDATGKEFRLVSQDTRAVFEWYRKNRPKWAQRNQRKTLRLSSTN